MKIQPNVADDTCSRECEQFMKHDAPCVPFRRKLAEDGIGPQLVDRHICPILHAAMTRVVEAAEKRPISKNAIA